MATTNKPDPDKGTEVKPDASADVGPPAYIETPEEHRARLRRELEELDREHGPAPVEPGPPTHVLVLATGERVETDAPVATHHHSDEAGGVVPVVSCFELQRS